MQGFYNGKTGEYIRENRKWYYRDTRVKYPDAKKHQLVSFLKSGVRLLGYIFLPFNLYIAMGILLVSEIIGIIEELV